jgi:hypothetical protein
LTAHRASRSTSAHRCIWSAECGVRVRKPYDLPRRGDVVGKGRYIVFRIEGCTGRAPYDIYRKARNTGREAAQASDLRGTVSKGQPTKTELTKYAGSHYVDV